MGSGVYVCALLPVSEGLRLAEGLQDSAAVDMAPFELLEARLLLEPECAALAAQHATPEQRTQLTQLHQAMEQAHSHPEKGKGPVDYDRMFHQAVANACPNAALASACMHLWDLRERSLVFQRLDEHFVTPAIWELAWNEHVRIVQAICAGDAVRARHAMAYHINAIMARLREDPEGWLS
ncbi:putative L-lactate dehydrogenase operon regulatory protein [compost metagenome]